MGDYSSWIPGGSASSGPAFRSSARTWGQHHELWRYDVRDVDLDLVADKVERAVRRAIVEQVLVLDEVKKRQFTVVVPPGLPDPLMSVLLATLFKINPQPATITLMPAPLTCCLAAGPRSALVIDIGWTETVVSAVYELRDVSCERSTRGMRRLIWEIQKLLKSHLMWVRKSWGLSVDADDSVPGLTFEECEEVAWRMAWCSPDPSKRDPSEHANTVISIPVPSQSDFSPVSVPFSDFDEVTASSFFCPHSKARSKSDSHALPLPDLVYNTLLALPTDVRAALLPRIIITGGGSHIPGLKSRLLRELTNILSTRGWDPVHDYGKTQKPCKHNSRLQWAPVESQRRFAGTRPGTGQKRRTIPRIEGPVEIREEREESQPPSPKINPAPPPEPVYTNKDEDENSTTPAHLQPPLPDRVLARLQPQPDPSQPSGQVVRSVQSLGPWAGASLLAGLRVRGAVEVERERFQTHGIETTSSL